jgi:hypothetical protein
VGEGGGQDGSCGVRKEQGVASLAEHDITLGGWRTQQADASLLR